MRYSYSSSKGAVSAKDVGRKMRKLLSDVVFGKKVRTWTDETNSKTLNNNTVLSTFYLTPTKASSRNIEENVYNEILINTKNMLSKFKLSKKF